jgi:hypothetical protein
VTRGERLCVLVADAWRARDDPELEAAVAPILAAVEAILAWHRLTDALDVLDPFLRRRA